jgi:hypothetical protein
MLNKANLAAIHANRVKLSCADIDFVRKFLSDKNCAKEPQKSDLESDTEKQKLISVPI